VERSHEKVKTKHETSKSLHPVSLTVCGRWNCGSI